MLRRYLIDGPHGSAIASGSLRHIASQYHPDRYYLHVQVDPDWRRRSFGSAMLDRLSAEALARKAELVRAETRASCESDLAWYARRGFREVIRGWDARLDLASFDPARFGDPAARAAAAGVAIAALDDVRAADSGFLRRYHAAWDEAARGEPDADPVTPLSFSLWLAEEVDPPNAIPGGHLVALDGADIAGFCSIVRNLSEPGVVSHALTGVLARWRGRGIATALTLAAIERAIASGARRLDTYNDTRNAPMIAINTRLGFVQGDAIVTLQRDLR
ncbi:MAG: GNAT family N-acetyltransferase [Chloroflexota bacterium]